MEYPVNREKVASCMDVYKAKIQSYGSLDKLNLIIVVIGDLKNKGVIRDTWYPTSSMWTQNYFLEDASNKKAKVNQLDFIGSFLQASIKHRFL